jgi:Tfp pilus assembly protein PilX
MRNQRGSILVATLGFVLVFTLFGFGSLYLSSMQSEDAEKKAGSNKSFWSAEAGLQKALWEYSHNNCQGLHKKTASGCDTTNATLCTAVAAGPNYCKTCGDKCLAFTLTGVDTQGNNYSVDYNVFLNNVNSLIKSTGSYPDRVTNPIQRSVQADNGSPFVYAAFAKRVLTIGNNIVADSYDSSAGLYGVGNQNNFGNIGTNGTTAGTINLGGNAVIKGDASTGQSGTIVYGNGNSAVQGLITHDNEVDLSIISAPPALSGLAASPALNVPTGGTATLNIDKKYPSITMGNNSTINVSGNVSIYLTAATSFSTGNNIIFNIPSGSKLTVYTDGTFRFGNNATINNVSQVAGNFKIYSTYSTYVSNGVALSNNATTAAAVYAPNTGVTISNNGDFYGAVIGETISLSGSSNSKIHFDQALGGTNPPIKNWKELSVHPL